MNTNKIYSMIPAVSGKLVNLLDPSRSITDPYLSYLKV